MPGIFDLVGQLSFYATYHTDSRNKAIHIVFVPVILWTALVWLSYTGPLFQVPQLPPVLGDLVFNGAFVAVSIYATYYVLLERNFAGVAAAALLLLGWKTATTFYQNDAESAWKVALVLHVIGWVSQFLGHGIFENRKPALFDNLVNALLLAPLFVFLEVLFAFGYRPSLAKHFHKTVGQKAAQMKKHDQKQSKEPKQTKQTKAKPAKQTKQTKATSKPEQKKTKKN